jgi:drug/metabolite transporter (DMT)-like permease
MRSAVAALALLLLLPEARRGWNWRAFAVGTAYAATLISFVMANKLTTSAEAIFLQSTAPLYLLVLGPLVLKEPLGARDLWFGLAVAAGAGLMFLSPEARTASAPDPERGTVFALLSGVAYACTLAGLRWQAHRVPGESAALATVTVGNVIVAAVCLPLAWPLPAVGLQDAAVIAYLGVFQIGAAYWLLTHGMRHVRAFEASILLLLEPVANPVVTWMWHGERPGTATLAGGAVIVAATFWKLISGRDAAD